jgi:hypothetical protein
MHQVLCWIRYSTPACLREVPEMFWGQLLAPTPMGGSMASGGLLDFFRETIQSLRG